MIRFIFQFTLCSTGVQMSNVGYSDLLLFCFLLMRSMIAWVVTIFTQFERLTYESVSRFQNIQEPFLFAAGYRAMQLSVRGHDHVIRGRDHARLAIVSKL